MTTLAGFSPLAAGLIEAAAPAPFDLLVEEDKGLELVAGIRSTSPEELVVAVSNGAEAKFVGEVDTARGLTVLRPKKSSGDVAAAVAGDYLLLGSGIDALRAASAHVATASVPEAPRGEIAEIVANHADLAGPAKAFVTRFGEAVRSRLEAADIETRAHHGGRAPDFADPKPVIAALGMLTEGLASVLSSTSRVRATARVDPGLSVHVEIAPEESGAARDFMAGLPRGDLSLFTGLPSWVDLAFLWHRRESTESAFTDRVATIFGDRLGPADRRRLETWANDLDRGLGRTAVIGAFGEGRGAGAFVIASGGDGRALRRAAIGLVDLVGIPALRAPIEAFAGRLNAKAREGSIARFPVTRVSLEVKAQGADAPIEYRAAAAANDRYGAIVIGSADVDGRLLDLLDERGRTSLGADRVLASVAKRIEARAACAASVRVRVGAHGEKEIAVLSAGSDEFIWLDMEGSLLALRALLSFPSDSAEP